MRQTIRIATNSREELIDITGEVLAVGQESGIRNGLVSVYAQGATGAIMIEIPRGKPRGISVCKEVNFIAFAHLPHCKQRGMCFALHVQENCDESVQTDVVNLLRQIIPQGVWLHDQQDGNGDAHLKAGLVGPSESIPIIDGELGLSRWQNIFFCEFDGPRAERRIVCTIIADSQP